MTQTQLKELGQQLAELNYKELATVLKPVAFKGDSTLFKATLDVLLVDKYDGLSEEQKGKIIESCAELYTNSDSSMFREDIQEEVVYAATTYQDENYENSQKQHKTRRKQ